MHVSLFEHFPSLHATQAGILEEFEKSRDGFQEALHQARLISKQRLASRLGGGKGKADRKGDDVDMENAPTQIEAMFEEGGCYVLLISCFHPSLDSK